MAALFGGGVADSETPIVNLMGQIFRLAILQRADEVHFIVRPDDSLDIRLHHGQGWTTLPPLTSRGSAISRLLVLGNLDKGEVARSKPQTASAVIYNIPMIFETEPIGLWRENIRVRISHPGSTASSTQTSTALSEVEVMQFLRTIEDGSVSLRAERDPQEVYAGEVSYVASNGWRITVFNDANEWDYIDHIQAADGRTLDFDGMQGMPTLMEYAPSDEIAWSRYGIPGYLKFRCARCGMELTIGPPFGPPFLCPTCRDQR
jgi:hypothetical protein